MTATAAPPEQRSADRAPRVAAWSFAGALVLIGAAAAYVLWRDRGWLSSSDFAFFEMELRRIPEQWLLVGAYSRYGWSHPGPLQYYLLWGPWRLFGGASVGLLFGMLLLHLAALVIAWFAARYRSLAASVLVAGALLVVWGAVGASEVLSPWNPLVGLLFGGTALVLAWNASTRGRVGAVLLLPVGSLLVQAHASTAPLVMAVCVVAALLVLLPVGQRDPTPWRWWLVGIAAAAVTWIPPLIDQVRGDGNLQQILSAASAGGPTLGLRQAATVLVDAFAVPPYWWKPAMAFVPSEIAVPWLLVPPILAVVVAVLKRDASQLRFLALAGTALLVALVSVSRFLDPFAYLGAWIPGMAMVIVGMSLWILAAAAGVERLVLLASPLILLLPAVGVVVALVTNPPPLEHVSTLARTGTQAIMREGLTDPGVHLDIASFEALPAFVAELERQGVPVSATTPGDWPQHLRSLIQSDPADRIRVQVREIWDPNELAPPGWRIIAVDDPFTADEWRQIRELRSAKTDAGLTDDERALSGWVLGDLLDGRNAWQILVPVD